MGSIGQPQGPHGSNYSLASPPGTSHGQPPNSVGGHAGGRPQTSASPVGVGDPSLLPLFRAVDKNGTCDLCIALLHASRSFSVVGISQVVEIEINATRCLQSRILTLQS